MHITRSIAGLNSTNSTERVDAPQAGTTQCTTRIETCKRQLGDLVCWLAGWTTISPALDHIRDLLERGEKPITVVLIDPSLELKPNMDKLGCTTNSADLNELYRKIATDMSMALRDAGLPLRVATAFNGTQINEVTDPSAAVSVPTYVCNGPGDAVRFEGTGIIVMKERLVLDKLPVALTDEIGRVFGLEHVSLHPEYKDLDPAIREWLCTSGPGQAGTVMEYTVDCDPSLDGPAGYRHSTTLGPLDLAVLQQQFNGAVDPKLMQQMLQGVVRRANLTCEPIEEFGSACPEQPIPPHESPLVDSLLAFQWRVGGNFIASLVGRIVDRAVEYAIVNALPAGESFNTAHAIVRDVLSAAVQGVVLATIGGYSVPAAAVVAGGSVAGGIALTLLAPDVAKALFKVIGELQISAAINEAVTGQGPTSIAVLGTGFLGRTVGKLACDGLEALVQHYKPETDANKRKELGEPRLVSGNVFPDLGACKILQDWSQAARKLLETGGDFNTLTKWVYGPTTTVQPRGDTHSTVVEMPDEVESSDDDSQEQYDTDEGDFELPPLPADASL